MQVRVVGRIALGLSFAGLSFACSSDDAGPDGSGIAGAGKGGVGGLSGFNGGAAGSPSGGAVTGGTGGTPNVAGSGVGPSGGTPSAGAGAGGTPSGGVPGGGAPSGGGGASSGGAGGGSSMGGGSPGTACPADATFCSGFEDTALPAGAVYKVNAAPGEWSRDFAVDTTVMRGGKSSLRVKSGSDTGTSGSSYQMLAVPAPNATFWARFYIRQADIDIGGVDHNVFAGASSSDEPNASGMVEFAEDVGVAFNTSDDVRWPANYGRINGATMPFSLPKGMWHCIEISFDSAARAQKLYVNGELKIDATGYPASVAMPFKVFKFGFNKLHGPARSVWYDDVAVGPTRPGCL